MLTARKLAAALVIATANLASIGTAEAQTVNPGLAGNTGQGALAGATGGVRLSPCRINPGSRACAESKRPSPGQPAAAGPSGGRRGPASQRR